MKTQKIALLSLFLLCFGPQAMHANSKLEAIDIDILNECTDQSDSKNGIYFQIAQSSRYPGGPINQTYEFVILHNGSKFIDSMGRNIKTSLSGQKVLEFKYNGTRDYLDIAKRPPGNPGYIPYGPWTLKADVNVSRGGGTIELQSARNNVDIKMDLICQ